MDEASAHGERVVALYREYGPAVYRRCVRLLGDREAAKDATQEVFVKLLRDIGKLADRETALPWIYRVATNHCLNLRRAARRHRDEDLDGALDVAPAARDAFPEGRLAREVLGRFDVQTQA